MGRTIDEVIAGLPAERQANIESRYRELRAEVEGLAELRRMVGRPQAEIAAGMGIRQPSISKIEGQSDIQLSTLRRYVEALGGELELVVRLPNQSPVSLTVTAGDGAVQRGTDAPGARKVKHRT